MNADTGGRLSGLDHIRQSIEDILTTPIGSRVMRRDYGSAIPDLLDQPLTPANQLRLYSASLIAINEWEPRVAISRISISAEQIVTGRFELSVDLVTTEGESSTLTVPLSSGGA